MRITQALLAGVLIAVAAVPSGAATRAEKAEARLAKVLEGRVAGEPVNCLPLFSIRSSEIIDGTAIVYRTGGNKLYVNRPTIGARSLDRDDILVTKTSMSQLCSIDTVRLLDRTSHFYTGFVGLGEFVPYTKVESASR